MTADAPEPAPGAPAPRKPRKIFLLLGLVVATALGIGLFTSVGTNAKSSGAPHEGGPLPAFSGIDLNGSGQAVVSSDSIGHGTPGVVLFFGNWCAACHTELPPLASAVRIQQSRAGALAHVKVIGVDSEDTTASAKGAAYHGQSAGKLPKPIDQSTCKRKAQFTSLQPLKRAPRALNCLGRSE